MPDGKEAENTGFVVTLRKTKHPRYFVLQTDSLLR